MDVARLTSELVKIRSENPPGYTDEVIMYIRDICDSIGLKTEVISRGKHWNLLSAHPRGDLLVCGHVDVVPALDDGWDHPPFSGEIDDDHVHGRGTTDMKGGCAALLAAISNVVEKTGECHADIAFVCDEEGNGEFGMEQLVEKGYVKPTDCLIAEPTPADTPWIGEKGVFRSKIIFSGNSGHSSLHPDFGNSAIIQACHFLQFCETVHERQWPSDILVEESIKVSARTLAESLDCSLEKAAKVLSHVSYNPGKIHGGERINVIAQRCELDMDMRIPWGCNLEILVEDLKKAAPEAEFIFYEKGCPTFSPPAWLCGVVCAGIEEVIGRPVQPGVAQAASDARHLRKKGSEVVIYGPGDLSLLHSVNESVSIRMLQDTSRVYEYVLNHIPGSS